MPRIRSIKPEFWTDEKTASLPSDTALFFIGLWTHADDHGYFPSPSRALSLLLPRWRPQVVESMLRRLEKDGLIRVSRGSGVGLVQGWHHQKIKDRRASKWSDVEITWDDPKDNAHGSEKNRPRIGEDRSGEDRRGVATGSQAPSAAPAFNLEVITTPKKEKTKRLAKGATDAGPTWEAYSGSYVVRYGTMPVRNVRVNSQLAQFVRRIGEEESPPVAAFYVKHNAQYYVRSGHAVGPMLADAEKLRTEWATGRRITSGEAQAADKKQTTYNAVQEVLDRIERKGAGNA